MHVDQVQNDTICALDFKRHSHSAFDEVTRIRLIVRQAVHWLAKILGIVVSVVIVKDLSLSLSRVLSQRHYWLLGRR